MDKHLAILAAGLMISIAPGLATSAGAETGAPAIYKFIRHLGPAGQPARPYLPADKEPDRPYELRRLVE
ncbi:MAG TPA: hypothetical protein VGV13_11280 [Methylomirabilota bacterium]|nr:hypothetical protein [Methylomirabilota bacterium]